MPCLKHAVVLGVVGVVLVACGSSGNGGDDAGPDTGAPDTGSPDTGTPDTGTPDTGTPDGGATGACINPTDDPLFAKAMFMGGVPPGPKTGDDAVTAITQDCVGRDPQRPENNGAGCISQSLPIAVGTMDDNPDTPTQEQVDALGTCLAECVPADVGELTPACTDCIANVGTCGALACAGECLCLAGLGVCCAMDAQGHLNCDTGSKCNTCLIEAGCIADFAACAGRPPKLFTCDQDPDDWGGATCVGSCDEVEGLCPST